MSNYLQWHPRGPKWGHLGDDGLATTFYAVFDADDLMRQFAS